MRVLVIGLIVLALSVAGISTYLIQNFSTPEAIGELEKKSRPIVNHVLVAKMDLVPGAVINGDAVIWREWPKDSMHENYISITEEDQKEPRFNEIVDSRVRRMINAGEPILSAKLFKSDMPGFMAGMVEKGMRAMAISVDPLSGVAGFVLPGDRVDILLVHDTAREAMQEISKNRVAQAQAEGQQGLPPDEEPQRIEILRTTTETILEDILVLAVDQNTGPIEGQSIPAKTLLFELTPKQVQILTTAQTMGNISVSLRNVGDNAVAEGSVGTPAEASPEASDSMDAEITVSGDGGVGVEHVTSGENTIAPYTTDVEVSPFIRKLTEEAANDSEEQASKHESEMMAADEAETAQKKELDALRQELEAAKESVQTAQQEAVVETAPVTEEPAPVKEKATETLEIYRGGAAETEVIQIQ